MVPSAIESLGYYKLKPWFDE